MPDRTREPEADCCQHRLTSRRALIARAGWLALCSGAPCWLRPAAALAGDASGSTVPPPAGLDAALLEQTLDRAKALSNLHTLMVARDGTEVVAEVFRGPGLDRPVNVKSVSKSVMAALAGAAIAHGILEGVDQRIAPVLDDLVPADADPRVRAITVDHLLTMRAGLERTSGRNYGRWVASRNWIRYALSRTFVADPGGRMLYSTGSYHLLSAVLTRASGKSTLALARDWLAEPLRIDIPPWTRDPQGIYLGGNNMALSPRALLRVRRNVPPWRRVRRPAYPARELDRSVLDAARTLAFHRARLRLRLVHRAGARAPRLLRLGLRRPDDLRRPEPGTYRGHDLGPHGTIGSKWPCPGAARPARRRHHPGGGRRCRPGRPDGAGTAAGDWRPG
jgi:CubicO group peptidase (beta-lactamase class C family)